MSTSVFVEPIGLADVGRGDERDDGWMTGARTLCETWHSLRPTALKLVGTTTPYAPSRACCLIDSSLDHTCHFGHGARSSCRNGYGSDPGCLDRPVKTKLLEHCLYVGVFVGLEIDKALLLPGSRVGLEILSYHRVLLLQRIRY